MEDAESGIIIHGMDVKINVVFKTEENMNKFQDALRYYNYIKPRPSNMVTLEGEASFPIQAIPRDRLSRITTEQYEHQDASPLLNVTRYTESETDSESSHAQHDQNPATNLEITLQMIERPNTPLFTGQIAKKCHLIPENDHPSNFLYVSSLFYQHFDGNNCTDGKIPSMLIHYHSHSTVAEQTKMANIFAYRTTVQIFFRQTKFFDALVQFLKTGTVVTANGKTAYQVDLFFGDGNRARDSLQAKEISTINLFWRVNDHSFDFLNS